MHAVKETIRIDDLESTMWNPELHEDEEAKLNKPSWYTHILMGLTKEELKYLEDRVNKEVRVNMMYWEKTKTISYCNFRATLKSIQKLDHPLNTEYKGKEKQKVDLLGVSTSRDIDGYMIALEVLEQIIKE